MTEHIIREQERRASIIDDICQQIVAKAARANADAPRHSCSAPSRQSSLPSRPFGECRLSQGEK